MKNLHNKIIIGLAVIVTLSLFPYQSSATSKYIITQLTDNLYQDLHPKINDNGDVVWQSYDGNDYEILLYDGDEIIQLTDNSFNDERPQINNYGYVVWHASVDGNDTEIFLYDGFKTKQITDDAFTDEQPQINDDGLVVWIGRDGNDTDIEIFLYDGDNITQLTDNSFHDRQPQINAYGEVAWYGGDGSCWDIFFYNGVITQITHSSPSLGCANDPRISDNHLVWNMSDGNDEEVILYDGNEIIQLTDNSFDDKSQDINNHGDVVWTGSNGSNSNIFLYDGYVTKQLTNEFNNLYPKINDDGYVVWQGRASSSNSYFHIFLYDGLGVTQLTDNPYHDGSAEINALGDIVWRGGDGNDYEIFLARPVTEIEVEIDIKPGSDPNSINLKSKGVVPVAVLTTDGFDAYDVDPDTCVFADAKPERWSMEDVDRDGDYDMLFHCRTQDLSLDEDSAEATFKGETMEKNAFIGTDSVRIVPQGKKK